MPKFVRARAENLEGYHPESQVHVEMSPEAFLRSLGSIGVPMEPSPWGEIEVDEEGIPIEPSPQDEGEPGFYVDKTSLEKVKARMVAEQEIDPLFVDFDIGLRKVTNHEGRHRALAAMELGIDRLPVIVFLYDHEGYHAQGVGPDGQEYGETHYVRRSELTKDEIDQIVERLDAVRTYTEPRGRYERRRPEETMYCVQEGRETPHERIVKSRYGVSHWRCTVCGQTRNKVTPSRRPLTREVRVRGHRRRSV